MQDMHSCCGAHLRPNRKRSLVSGSITMLLLSRPRPLLALRRPLLLLRLERPGLLSDLHSSHASLILQYRHSCSLHVQLLQLGFPQSTSEASRKDAGAAVVLQSSGTCMTAGQWPFTSLCWLGQ